MHTHLQPVFIQHQQQQKKNELNIKCSYQCSNPLPCSIHVSRLAIHRHFILFLHKIKSCVIFQHSPHHNHITQPFGFESGFFSARQSAHKTHCNENFVSRSAGDVELPKTKQCQQNREWAYMWQYDNAIEAQQTQFSAFSVN